MLHEDGPYLKALELSKGRSTRAHRTLAKRSFNRGDFDACIKHARAAVDVNPLDHQTWFLMGCAALKSKQLVVAATVRCQLAVKLAQLSAA